MTSQLMVESRNDRVQNAWGLGLPRTRLHGGKQENFKIKGEKKNGELSYWKEVRRRQWGEAWRHAFYATDGFFDVFANFQSFFQPENLRSHLAMSTDDKLIATHTLARMAEMHLQHLAVLRE